LRKSEKVSSFSSLNSEDEVEDEADEDEADEDDDDDDEDDEDEDNESAEAEAANSRMERPTAFDGLDQEQKNDNIER
jgi:hypothetical protein